MQMKKIRVAIAGASGYAGAELVRLTALHPHFELHAVTSEKSAGTPVAAVFPSLAGLVSLSFQALCIGPDIADTVRNDPYRVAFVRLQSDKRLYRESPTAVTFLTPTVFRAAIPLPADVPTGNFAVDVKLFADGAMVARTNSALEVTKVGFEQYVADAARDNGLLYGIATALISLAIGWTASVVFRRD